MWVSLSTKVPEVVAQVTRSASGSRTIVSLKIPIHLSFLHYPKEGPLSTSALDLQLSTSQFKQHQRRYSNIIKDGTPSPLTDKILAHCTTAQFWGKIDMTNSFFNTQVTEEDMKKTAIHTPWCLYKWVVMPMGLCNLPATHQWWVNNALGALISELRYIDLDNIIIFSNSAEEHTISTRRVLEALKDAKLYCSPKKTVLSFFDIWFPAWDSQLPLTGSLVLEEESQRGLQTNQGRHHLSSLLETNWSQFCRSNLGDDRHQQHKRRRCIDVWHGRQLTSIFVCTFLLKWTMLLMNSNSLWLLGVSNIGELIYLAPSSLCSPTTTPSRNITLNWNFWNTKRDGMTFWQILIPS